MSVPFGVVTSVLGSSDTPVPTYVGNKLSTVIVSAASGTSSQTLLTGNPGYYITRFYVTVDPICTVASAGMVEITAVDSQLGIIGRTRVYIPSSFQPSQAVVTPSLVTVSDYGFFFLAPTSNSTVTVQSNTALTGSGIIRVTANYGYTNDLGS